MIGVQTPEYAFEHVASNVAAGARRLHITYPVALDDHYTTWNNYGNDSWPADYLIDSTGTVRYVSIGEGNYPQTESLIRQLLTAAHPGVHLPPPTQVADTTPTSPDQTPETYLGAARADSYGGRSSVGAAGRPWPFPRPCPLTNSPSPAPGRSHDADREAERGHRAELHGGFHLVHRGPGR